MLQISWKEKNCKSKGCISFFRMGKVKLFVSSLQIWFPINYFSLKLHHQLIKLEAEKLSAKWIVSGKILNLSQGQVGKWSVVLNWHSKLLINMTYWSKEKTGTLRTKNAGCLFSVWFGIIGKGMHPNFIANYWMKKCTVRMKESYSQVQHKDSEQA